MAGGSESTQWPRTHSENAGNRATEVDFTPIVGLEPTTLGLTVPRSTS